MPEKVLLLIAFVVIGAVITIACGLAAFIDFFRNRRPR